jgi:uncharacterized protein (DUF983 family)
MGPLRTLWRRLWGRCPRCRTILHHWDRSGRDYCDACEVRWQGGKAYDGALERTK